MRLRGIGMKKYRIREFSLMWFAPKVLAIALLYGVMILTCFMTIEFSKYTSDRKEFNVDLLSQIVKVELHDEEMTEQDKVEAYINSKSAEYGLDPEIVKAVIKVESNWQHDLIGDNGQSYGLMQIQPRWHQARMDRLGVTDLLNPEQNVLVGCDLLAELLEKTNGDLDKALTIYNAGHDNGSREYASRIRSVMQKSN